MYDAILAARMKHWVVLFLFCCVVSFSYSQDQPNILLILADDLGIGDLTIYNPDSKVPTPHIDRLARQGLRFTDAYCPSAVCSPTRYSLFTGEYPWRSWKKTGVLANWERSMINENTLTLTQMLQKAGYYTIGIGKWHLGAIFPTKDGKPALGIGKFKSENTGQNIDIQKDVLEGPIDRGFEYWHGFSCASEQLILRNRKVVSLLGHDLYTPPAAEGVDQLPKIPLKDYLADMLTETKQLLKEQVDKEKPFFLYFSPYVPHIPLAVEDRFLESTRAGEYGDYVAQLDHYVGELISALKNYGLDDNTLIIFASDNGSQFIETGEGKHMPNYPFSGIKWTVREGGVRTPLIFHWVGVIEENSVNKQIIGLNDIMATLAGLLDYPIESEQAKDSLDFSEVLLGNENESIRKSISLLSVNGLNALRMGKWKYIDGSGDRRRETTDNYIPQLYDLEQDPAEQNNLAAKMPEQVAIMQRELKLILGN